MDIGNKNIDSFKMACILCGAEHDMTLTAFRNRHQNITGWLVACEECQKEALPDWEVEIKQKNLK